MRNIYNTELRLASNMSDLPGWLVIKCMYNISHEKWTRFRSISMWNSNGTIFRRKLFILMFVVYPTFHIYYKREVINRNYAILFIGFLSLLTYQWHFENGN